MLAIRSRMTTDDAGWAWLGPERHSLTLRHGVVSMVLSVMLVGAAAAATLPPPLLAVPLLAAVVGAGALLARATWRETHTRLGVSALGLVTQRGAEHDQLGWPTVLAVTGEQRARRGRRGRRVRIRVDTRSGAIRRPRHLQRGPGARLAGRVRWPCAQPSTGSRSRTGRARVRRGRRQAVSATSAVSAGALTR
jgi:hypothetical protein